MVPLGAAAIYANNHGAVFGIAMVFMLCGLALFAKLK
ncbi:MAG: hypothetical protein JWO30_3467 [Fibrobacteres bacterium]|nr:hypothetical protein [Fibrobacterota bacterium]